MTGIVKKIIPFIALITVTTLIEVFIFNVSHWKTVGSDCKSLRVEDVLLATDNLWQEETQIVVAPSDSDSVFVLPVPLDAKTLSITFSSEGEVFERYFNVKKSITEKYRATNNVVGVNIIYSNAEGKQISQKQEYFIIDEHKENIIPISMGTSYVTVELLHDSYFGQKETYAIKTIEINKSISLHFSLFRFLTVAVVSIFLFCIRKKSVLWKVPLSKRKFLCLILPLLLFGIILLWESKNPFWWNGNCFVDSYGELTKAFANGQVALDIQPSEALTMMDNPYDYYERETAGVDYLFDYAYYEGKYYVYFGALPAILRLPVYLLTGKMIPYPALFNAALLLFLVGLAFCLKAYGERYYIKISVCEYLVLYLLWVVLAYLPLLFFAGFNYTLPQIYAAALLVWGLFFYIDAGGKDNAVKRKLVLGSFCMALITLCRPQLVLAVVLAIPLLKDKMCKKGTLKLWLSFMLPFVLVAIPVMWYNYARFESIADFGAYYNLTNGNIHEAKMSFTTILRAFQYYLMTGWRGRAEFPFMNLYEPSIVIPNVSVTQLVAGYLMTFPIALLPVFYWPRTKRNPQKKESRLMQVFCLVLTAVMISVATFYFSFRYAFDFSIVLGLAVIIACTNLMGRKYSKLFGFLLGVIIVISAAVTFMVGFTDNIDTLNVYFFNRDFWWEMRHLITFWKY
ncbi:MAG: hypothetical protein MJ105_03310 [Lachnospiraceae bacterium]|nr:hypothetical protein [Lachnospiraceae bacterium]